MPRERSLGVLVVLLLAACGDDSATAPTDAGEDATTPADAAPDAGAADAGRDATIPGFDGPGDEIEIRVDDLGIPHIYASSDVDAFYGAGYQMAVDRLFQMDLQRRRALGRWAEVLGPARANDDELSRLLRFGALGWRDWDRIDREYPEARALLVAWTAGINRRIDEVRGGAAPLPYGFGPDALDYMPERWHPADVIAVSRMSFFATSNVLEPELFVSVLRSLVPDLFDRVQLLRPLYPTFSIPAAERPAPRAGASLPLPPAAPRGSTPIDPREVIDSMAHIHRVLSPLTTAGSNNWAIDGRFTDNGRSLIANDPHLPLESPSEMYGLHIDSKERGGTLDVVGFTLVGSIGISLGHNDRVAWTATTSFADGIDVWEVAFSEGGVRVGDETLPVVVHEEPIVVRGEGMPAGVGTTDMYRVSEVEGRGVLLPRDLTPVPIAAPGHGLLMNFVGFQPISDPSGLMALQRAQSLDELEEVFRTGVAQLGFNFVGADAHGIVYRVGEAVPDRGDPATHQAPWLVMDGSDPSSYWTGALLPPDRLPHTRAPDRGWIATANNDPFGFTADGRTDDDPWYYGAFFDPGFRAKRIEDELTRLTARGSVTVDDMHALQTDSHSTLADALIPLLEDAWSHLDTDPALAELRDRSDLVPLMDRLHGWDRRMARDSTGALAFRAFAFMIASRVLEDDVGFAYRTALGLAEGAFFILKAAALALQGAYPDGGVLLSEPRDVLLLRSLADTADWLTMRFGSSAPEGATYAMVHGTVFESVAGGRLDIGFVPTDGAEDTIDNSPSTFYDGMPVAERWESRQGPLFRIVSSFAADGVPESTIALPPGNAADPASPHFRDLLDDWVEGRYRVLPFRRADVEAATESTTTIPPR